MGKTMAERIREMAETLSQKAQEIRERTQGSDSHDNTTENKRISK